ncbi:MAG: N-acetyltransferase [Methanomassiliicoccus sp.]|nr:N-acetyltransferase [Methanomassiliicoccus sp.]
MNHRLTIRMASEDDAAELLAIYAPYVTGTAITFEYTMPTVEEFRRRIGSVLTGYPFLVAMTGDGIAGYAYASAFKERAAYNWSAETTVYVRQERRGAGIGKALYLELERILREQRIVNLNACISYPNPGSIGFHERMGYRTVGHFTKCGYKFGRWWDMIWMEKMIGEHHPVPEPVVPVTRLDLHFGGRQ